MRDFTHSLDGRTFISSTWLGPYPNSSEAEVYEIDNLDDARALLERFNRDACALQTFSEIIRKLEGPGALCRSDDSEVLAQIARLLAQQRLFLLEVPCLTGTWPTVPYPEEEQEEPIATAPQTWIEIQLIDNDGAPVAGEKLRIRLPDGSVVEVTTRTDGVTRVGDFESGACEVEAVDLANDVWERA